MSGINHKRRPVAGAGLGLRTPHIQTILDEQPAIGWFEVLTDNYFGPGGLALKQLEAVRERYPITMHSVGLSIGSVDPLDRNYLNSLKELADRFEPDWISEHLCWTSAHGQHFHDLLPLPYTEETIKHVAARVQQVQEALGRQILLENVSSYLSYKESEMTEGQFVAEIARRADCLVLLDINNIYVSGHNHDFDPRRYFDEIPPERVREMHLGGHEDRGDYLLDAHNAAPTDEVWSLYAEAVSRFGPISTLIEWDNDLPEFSVLASEAARAQLILDGGHEQVSATAATLS